MPAPPPLENPNLGPWNGEFRDREMEKRFRQATVRDWARQLSWIAMVGGVFFLVGFWVDYLILGLSVKCSGLCHRCLAPASAGPGQAALVRSRLRLSPRTGISNYMTCPSG